MTAGSIVLSDHGLVSFFETPNAEDVCILYLSTGLPFSPFASSFLKKPASSQTRLRLPSPPTSCKYQCFVACILNNIYTSNQKAMESLAFARAEQPRSPRIKTEDASSSGDSTSSSSWLTGIKQKIYEMFRKSLPCSSTSQTADLIDRGFRCHHFYESISVEILARHLGQTRPHPKRLP
jgi:hypothetical protein